MESAPKRIHTCTFLHQVNIPAWESPRLSFDLRVALNTCKSHSESYNINVLIIHGNSKRNHEAGNQIKLQNWNIKSCGKPEPLGLNFMAWLLAEIMQKSCYRYNPDLLAERVFPLLCFIGSVRKTQMSWAQLPIIIHI